VDEIKLFEELQPPVPPDAPRMREAVRARLAAATTAPPAHPARRRGTMVAATTAAALVAAGAGYSLTAAQGSSGSLRSSAAAREGSNPTRGGSSSVRSTAAGLTAVHGCPGMYITAGTLERVSGAQLIVQPPNLIRHANKAWQARQVTVVTSPSTAITRPASGTVGDITDGSQVVVRGAWSGAKLAAAEVDIGAGLPTPSPLHPHAGHVRTHLPPEGSLGPPVAIGTVVDAHDGSFTVVMRAPFGGTLADVQVITSSSTEVVARAGAGPSQLDLGANVVAVGQIGANGVLTASAVAESSAGVLSIVADGLAKVSPSSCSASDITTAAILAGD
jgi:hypothetical protein